MSGVPSTLFYLYIRSLSRDCLSKDSPLQEKQITGLANDLYLLVGPSPNITEDQVEELLKGNLSGVLKYLAVRRDYTEKVLGLIEDHVDIILSEMYLGEKQGSFYNKRWFTKKKYLRNEIGVLEELIQRLQPKAPR